jgi:hypothetical protein
VQLSLRVTFVSLLAVPASDHELARARPATAVSAGGLQKNQLERRFCLTVKPFVTT